MGDEWAGQRLHQYAIYDRYDALEDILQGEERENINAPDRCGRTPVYTAVSNNSIRCLEVLLQHGADPSINGGVRVHSMTPLHQAVYECKIDAIKLLLQYGADMNKEDDTGGSPYSLAKSINSQDYAKLFQEELERRKKNTMSVVKDLCEAIKARNVNKARDILKVPPPSGWEIANIVLDDGTTPLELAVNLGDSVVMFDLLHTMTELPPTSTVLHCAVEQGNVEIIQQILKKFPASCKTKDDSSMLPFHIACQSGSLEIVKLLIEWEYPDNVYQSVYDRGKEYLVPFPLNDVAADGKTALFMACELGYEDIVEYMINYTIKGRRVRSNSVRSSDDMSSAGSIFDDDEVIYDDINPIHIDAVEETPIQIESGFEESVTYRRTNIRLPVKHSMSCVYISVLNRHLKIVEMLAGLGGKLNLTLRSSGHEYSLLLQVALHNSDLLMLNKLLLLGVEDINNHVFEEAVKSYPNFIAHFLKYKAEKDKTNSVNKVRMKKEYDLFSGSLRSSDSSSVDPNDTRIFPENPVNIRWQNLNVLSTVESSWLATTVNFFNPTMNPMNQRNAHYAVTRVDVSNNNITMVPTALLQLPSLSVLSLSNNQITAFPSEASIHLEGQFLEELNIQHNKLTTIPDYIFTLPKLRILNANNNVISLLPASMWASEFLKTIDLSHNKLITLPPPIVATRKESEGSLAGDSPLTSMEFPMDQSMSSIESHVTMHTVMRANQWFDTLTINDEAVRVSENQTKGLKTLKLNNNFIEIFPEFLSCSASKLEMLELKSNKLKSLGSLGSYPKLLKSLDLSYNCITNMANWQVVDGKKCFCSEKSSGFTASGLFGASIAQCGHRSHTKLENLEVLDLTHNKLTELLVLKTKDLSASIDHMASNLKDKEEIEKEKQGRLLCPNIINLHLDENYLVSLPDDIQEMKTLKTLTLKKNIKLKQLPPPLGLLDRLHRIEVDMCPLEGPIRDVLNGSTGKASDITGFLRSVLEESEEYNCMNLMIVGSFNIGKTSLLQHLMKKGKAQAMLHFNQRQNSTASGTMQDGKPLSTVGIDINNLLLTDRLDNKQTATVEFRTWDFAGQREYYATHQYFLSPRSLYLVVWNLTTGDIGVEGLRQWLVNIQAQAPGAPVIIVGTHLDEIQKNKEKMYTKDWEVSMMKKIQDKYIRKDNSAVGLPRTIDVINVGAGKKAINIDKLYKSIFDKVFSLKHPARKTENLLGHMVPKKYIKLQSVIHDIVTLLKKEGKEPVLDANAYLLMVMQGMSKTESLTSFRNKEDLHQATRFLHENGVLCHFEDSSLKDQYFLDPQWLCDQLAKVVSIKEVQQYSKQGIMKVKDLYQKYRDSDKIGKYILSLLNKFEVALQFDSEHLLLPSLLPDVEELAPEKMREIPIQRTGSFISMGSSVISNSSSVGIGAMFSSSTIEHHGSLSLISTNSDINPAFSNTRLYLLTHFPSGFWPRLITRILADETIEIPVTKMFEFPQDIIDKCPELLKETPKWRCWQTGFEIVYCENVIMQVKEVQAGSVYASGMCDYLDKGLNIECHFDSQWGELDVEDSVILEISFKADKLTFHFQESHGNKTPNFRSIDSRDIFHDEQAKAGILAKIVEHIDCLLQDWFPEIGESRFIQSCSGRYLVTRVIPCPLCLVAQIKHQKTASNTWVLYSGELDQTQDVSISHDHTKRVMCTFLVEKCIKNIMDGMNEICRIHGSVSPKHMTSADGVNRVIHIAPDAVFQDLDESFVVGDDMVHIMQELGHGAFGTVSKGKLRRSDGTEFDVAVKVLYSNVAKDSRKHQQQSQVCLETVCSAYTTARQEVSILQTVEHPHIVPLLGLSRRPLALLLALAPLGSLHSIFEKRHKDGQRLPIWVIKQIVIQVADALDYLHGRKIIYRDLKSDNVLVWHIPPANSIDPLQPTLVKLADYGISKSVLPGGAKGFGGTPPFIAPEILLHTGRDTYTEKVDVFSFGMFMFELLTCRNPLCEISNVNVHVIHGGRPTLTTEEAVYPSHMLDLMNICWDHYPENRPSAAQIRLIASSPQFCHLSDAVTMEIESTVLSACSMFVEVQDVGFSAYEQPMDHTQVWMVSKTRENINLEIVSYNNCNKCVSYKGLKVDATIYAVCKVKQKIWCLDKQGTILVYSPGTLEREEEFQLPVQSVEYVKSITYHHNNGGYVVILMKEHKKRTSSIFYLTEDMLRSGDLPQPIEIAGNCFCSVVVKSNDTFKLWHGCNDNAVHIRDISDVDSNPITITPNDAPINRQQICRFIITDESSVSDTHIAWTYNYPGSKVYRWDTDSEQVETVLDCANKIPAVDSLHVRASHKFKANLYQVTCLAVVDRYLYVGTTWGCIIVADAVSMEPYSVFRCHGDEEFYCKAVLPLGMQTSGLQQRPGDLVLYQRQNSKDKRASEGHDISGGYQGVVTIGRGYCDVIKYVTRLGKDGFAKKDTNDGWSPMDSSASPELTTSHDVSKLHTHLLSWEPKHWEYY